MDPIGIAGGLNVYGFANGDPINFSDPFGLSACPPGQVDAGDDYCVVMLTFPGIGPGGRGLVAWARSLPAAGRRAETLVRHSRNLRGYLQHLTPRDLSGAATELRGAQSGGQHLQEVREAVSGLRQFVNVMKQAMSNPDLTRGELAAYSRMLGIASRALDRAEDALRIVP
jgi:hypothetical protein